MPGRQSAKPLVAIVGRPNVGKSTLFNRLVRQRRAIVDDLPGVTRDRLYGEADWLGRTFAVVDTGGFDPLAGEPMLQLMREQAQLALEEADAVIFVVDARDGLTQTDREIAALLRRGQRPILVAANKVEGRTVRAAAAEAYELGFERVYAISAEHGEGVLDMVEELVELLPPYEEEAEDADVRTRVAIIGRPNVGKSTLVNRLVGTERMLASAMPGTTRDAVDTPLDVGERRYLLVDTAGIRRKRSIAMRVERYSVLKAIRVIERTHAVVLLLDPTEGVTEQDARLARLVHDRGRPIVFAVNKWDAVADKDSSTAGEWVHHLRERLPFYADAPVVFISALTGQRATKVLDLVDEVVARWRQRISTSALNRFYADVIERHPPPVHRGRTVRIYYLTQVSTEPPTIVAWANYPDAIAEHYRRYLVNALRDHFDFAGTPVRLVVRERSR